MALFLASHWETGWAVTASNGRPAHHHCPGRVRLRRRRHPRHRHLLNLIVDLSELTWADGGGLGALMSVRALPDEDEGGLRQVGPE